MLYTTPKYRDMILSVVVRELNRVYNLFIDRNPSFLKIGGKVSIYGHSLGSLAAFDILCHQSILNSPFNNDDVDRIFGVCPQNDFRDSYISNVHDKVNNGFRYSSGDLYNLMGINGINGISDDGMRLSSRDGVNGINGINGVNGANRFRKSGLFNQLYDEPERDIERYSRDFESKMYHQRLQQLKYKLDFEVDTLFSVGSPIGLFLLLKGVKIGSRKYYDVLNKINESKTWSEVDLDGHDDEIDLNGSDNGTEENSEIRYGETWMNNQRKSPRQNLNKDQFMMQDQSSSIPHCFPAVNNIYNIFHKSGELQII